MTSERRRGLLTAAGALAIGAATGRTLLDSMNAPDPRVLAVLAENADATEVATRAGASNAAARAGASMRADDPPRRLVLVVLDGLGERVFDEVARDVDLGPVGLRATVDVGTPSLSRPVYHELLTGLPQGVSGIRNNAHSGRARADDLTARVRQSGGSVGWALETVPWFHDLFGRPEDTLVRLGEEPRWNAVTDRFDGPPRPDGERVEAMARVLRGAPALAVLHFTGIDHAGHHRGAESPEYRAAAESAFRSVKALRETRWGDVVSAEAVWMIGSDHGHLARGGHGGPEPEVRRTRWIGLWPSGAARRQPGSGDVATGDAPSGAARGQAGSRDIAPGDGASGPGSPGRVEEVVSADRLAATFAAILGVPAPRQALGDPLPSPDHPAPRDQARERRRLAVQQAVAESTHEAHRGLGIRAAVVVASLLALVTLAIRGGARREKALALLGAAAPVLTACLCFVALGPGTTLSAIRTHFAFMSRSLAAVALGAALGAPLFLRFRTPSRWLFLAAAALPASAWAITAGSLGASRLGDEWLLILPATGLVPWGVAFGVAGVTALLGRLRARARTGD